MSVWSVTYRDAEVEHVAEMTFDDACAFEEHFNVSAANLQGEKFQVRYIAWCIHRALTREGLVKETYHEWRSRVLEFAPMIADDTNPSNPTV